jgi:hypothetical protein
MGWWSDWRATQERRRRATFFAGRCADVPPVEWLAWLEELCGDAGRARQELELAMRAIGLIVAERDALDDRTVSEVARAMAPVLAREVAEMPERAAAWGTRWRAYGEAMNRRGVSEPALYRLGRVLLAAVGVEAPDDAQVRRAATAVGDMRERLNASLRRAFGEAKLPEDVRPSALQWR